jgi:hypothetical protein
MTALLARSAGLASALLILLISLAIFVPLSPVYPANTLDSGWMFALNDAIAHGRVFGRDIVFTFGPYGSLFTAQYNPATDRQMLWSGVLVASGFAASLICLTQGKQRLIALAFAFFLILLPRDTQFFAVPFLMLMLLCRVMLPADHPSFVAPTLGVKITLALTVIVLSLLPLVKGTFGMAAGAVMLLGCLLLALRGHLMLAAAGLAAFVASMLALWGLAPQPLAALPQFFLKQRPVISGYSAAMGVHGPAWQIGVFAGCCLLLALLTGRPLLRSGAPGRVLFAGTALLLFLAFKEGFIRDDDHVFTAAAMLGVTGWGILLDRVGWVPVLCLAIGMSGRSAIDASQGGLSPAIIKYVFEARTLETLDGLRVRLIEPARLQHNYTTALASIRAEVKLPRLQGTTDIYSADQSALLAAGLDYDPRPIPQSYSAYTLVLERENADHLTGATAPTNILFAVQPIDNRFPALEDGLSWPLLLTRYDITGLNDGFAILQKNTTRPPVNPFAGSPAIAGTFRLGQTVKLPANMPLVWAKIDLRPSLAGKLNSFLFKPPRLDITYRFANGSAETFRYIAAMGAAGFIAAPLVQNATDFAALALPINANYFAGNPPTSLSIDADYGAGWLWRSSFKVSFRALQIPVQPAVTQIFFPPFKTEPQPATRLPPTSDCSIDAINQQPAIHSPVTVRDFLRVDGWAAISMKNGTLPDLTKITLTAANGTITALPAEAVMRPDVNNYFNKPDLGPVGFTASGDVTALTGDQRLGLELSRNGQRWACMTKIEIHILNQ